MRFWDTSAIVPLLVREATSDSFRAAIEDDSAMWIWWATPVECVAAIARLQREAALTMAEATAALARLDTYSAVWREVLAVERVRTTARRLLRVHNLRAADSLQLAAAVVAAEEQPPAMDFMTLDKRLGDAAEREGFQVLVLQ